MSVSLHQLLTKIKICKGFVQNFALRFRFRISSLTDSGRFNFIVCDTVWFSSFQPCLFSHMVLEMSVTALQRSVRLLPAIQKILFPVSPPPDHMFSCWPWRVEHNEERVRVSRKGICLIYGLVGDESDMAAVFS